MNPNVSLLVTPMGLRIGQVAIPCSFGRGGISADKREGDGATPAGTHRITGCLYRPDRGPPPAPWARPLRPGDLWCDEPGAEDYNHLTRAPLSKSHERLRRADRLYDVILLTDWNWPNAVPGHGSAIFLHRWRKPGHPTEGCIAMHPRALAWLASVAAPGTPLVVPALAAMRASRSR